MSSFHPCNSRLLGLAHHLELPPGSSGNIKDIFFRQVHQILLETDLRWMTLTEIRCTNRSCQYRLGDSSLLLLIYKAATSWWLFIWPYSQSVFEDDLKEQMVYFFMSSLSLLDWNECSLSVLFQPVVSCIMINCPPEDKCLHPMQFLYFPLRKCSHLHDKSVNSNKVWMVAHTAVAFWWYSYTVPSHLVRFLQRRLLNDWKRRYGPGVIHISEQAASGLYFVSCQLLSELQLWFM